MRDEDKTKSQLIAELRELRSQTAALNPLSEDTQSIALGLTRFYFENVSIGIHQLAMDGRILNANPYAADMLGYTVKELTALSIFDIDPYMSADAMETDLETLATCQWDSFETVHLKKDGSQIPVEITSNRMEYGGQQYAFVFIKDIRSRKKMEKKLRQNERMLRRIMDIVPSMIFVKNKEGRFLMVNQAIADSLGMTVDELEGRMHRDVHPDPDEVERMLADDRRAIESGEKIFIVEEPYRESAGDRRWLRTIKVPCDEDEFGEPAVVGLAMDITERKRMEHALMENEERLRDLVSNVPGVVYQYKADPNSLLSSRLTSVIRERVIDMFGLDSEMEPFFSEFVACLPESDRDRFSMSLKNALEKEAPWHYEGQFTKPSGDTLWFEGNSVPRRVDEELIYYGVLMDITQRKQSQAALRENEQLLLNILESMNEGIIVLDNEFRYQIFNKAVEKITLTKRQEAFGKRPWEVFSSIRGSVTEENIRKAMSGEPQGEMEVQLSLAHNEDAWFRENFTPLKNVDGQIVGVIGVISEITRQKQDEEKLHHLIHELKESEARFKALHNASFGGIMIHDQGRILECNQGLAEITGYAVDELIGMDGMLLLTQRSRHMVRDIIASGYQEPYEAFGLRKNGEEYPVRLAARNIPYKGRQVRTVEFRDITQQKKAEGELHHLKNYLSNIIDSMPSVLVGVDREGRVTQWNRKARQATGLSLEMVLGLPLAQVFPSLAGQMQQIETAIRECRVISSPKVVCKTKTGSRYDNITVFPLKDNSMEGAVIRVDDVTEQVRLEEMMIQSEKMLSVGGLAAGMAHEINNPLAGMMQTANVMRSRLQDLSIPANLKAADEVGVSIEKMGAFMEKRGILRMINAINESGRRMSEIVNNMLSFARKSDAALSSCDPIQLLDRTLELATTDYDLKKQHDFKTIKIIKEYEKNLPMIFCEGAKIQQVLLNILRNGAQAMQNRDAGSREFPCFILRLAREESMLRIEIQDNGPGMDKAIRSRIFEPFFTTKPVGVGTGLGLSVSYFIITQNHGGTMDVVSSPGKGANFIIRLPLEK
ncbi:PAS domain S-box protein [uncultured Desulfobacter sp.]|uniref:PAS domain S-box protein n=1 Tax=uncultured Desulfobacter sp. TaxID=240139 RepID=UPI0029F49F31|nr:PAS domain S-box protein [uncultured Desulfobacter sp.]